MFVTTSDDNDQPRKKNPSAAVDGNASMIPETLASTFSAIKVRTAMNIPPTMNDVINWI